MEKQQYPPQQPVQPAPTSVPPPMYTNQPPQQVYTNQPPPMMLGPMRFSENPMQMQCPSCRAAIVSRTTHKVGLLAWLICGGLCFFGFWLGCQFIPFCIDACKDVDHSCPNCNAFLGSYKRI